MPPPPMTREERNVRALATLHPSFHALLAELILQLQQTISLKTGLHFAPLIVQARRTRAEQEKLYAAFLAGGPRAAPPGRSWHELGLAADLVDVAGGTERDRYDPADWEATDYVVIAHRALALGMVPGHLWEKRDSPHLEWHPGWGPKQAHLLYQQFPDGIMPDDFFDRHVVTDA